MSHQQIIYVDFSQSHKEDLIRVCSEGIAQLTKLSKETANKNLQEVLLTKIHSINEILNKVENNEYSFSLLAGASKMQINNFLDGQCETLSKEVNNIINSLSKEQLEKIISYQKESVDIFHFIEKYGSIVSDAIKELQINKLEINNENLETVIKQLNLQNANIEQLSAFIKQTQERIKQIFSNDQITQYELITTLRRDVKTNQQMNDFSHWLERKKDSYPKILNLFQTISKRLAAYEDYRLIAIKGQKQIVQIKDGFLYITRSYKNKFGEIIDININEEMKINYKIGNDYERHACEETSKQIFAALEENKRIKIINFKKIREFYGASYKQNTIIKAKTVEKKRGK